MANSRTIKLDDETYNLLRFIKEKFDIPITRAVRKAVRTYWKPRARKGE